MKGWVIGGTSGIGRACVDQMAPHMVVSATGAEEFDVRSTMKEWVGQIHDLGWPTHIVYAAGVNQLGWMGDGPMNISHKDVIDVNLVGFITMMDALVVAGKMTPERRRGGYPFGVMPSIVAISSDAAERPLRTSIGYCASKAGLNMAVKVAARELGPHGWRINAVAPGMTKDTGMQEYVDKRVQEVRGWSYGEMMDYEKSQEVVPGRIKPEDVAKVVLSTLMGPKHLNGSIITINGGR